MTCSMNWAYFPTSYNRCGCCIMHCNIGGCSIVISVIISQYKHWWQTQSWDWLNYQPSWQWKTIVTHRRILCKMFWKNTDPMFSGNLGRQWILSYYMYLDIKTSNVWIDILKELHWHPLIMLCLKVSNSYFPDSCWDLENLVKILFHLCWKIMAWAGWILATRENGMFW